jgi:hypothetical protein
MTIAQRFNAGFYQSIHLKSPKGRKEISSVPDGTRVLVDTVIPALKGWAILENVL